MGYQISLHCGVFIHPLIGPVNNQPPMVEQIPLRNSPSYPSSVCIIQVELGEQSFFSATNWRSSVALSSPLLFAFYEMV